MTKFDTPAVARDLETALRLQAGLKAWSEVDREVSPSKLAKAFRDNWDCRVGGLKFGGVWSIGVARGNARHPASKAAIGIPRNEWTGRTVTVEHAIPIKVMFGFFWDAQTDWDMQKIIDAYAVAVVTREENARLRDAKLGQSMPKGWHFGDDPLARWRTVGIEVELRSNAMSA